MSQRSMSSSPTARSVSRSFTVQKKWETSTLRFPRRRSTFFNEPTLSDITIAFGDQKIFAHKFVLVENSIWFEKALLGEFKESKQSEIKIGDDDDPAALTAMLRYFYDGIYTTYAPGVDPADQHLAMYRLADLYDAPNLRNEASRELIVSLKPISVPAGEWEPPGCHMTDKAILSIQQILGPEADSFADNSIQRTVYEHVIKHKQLFYKNQLFQSLLAEGVMFNESFGREFAHHIGEIISRLHSASCYCRRNDYVDW